MKVIASAIVFISLCLVPCCSRELANEPHHYAALEWDVQSPKDNPCTTERGFFGRSAKFDQTFSYQYELTIIDGEYLDDAMAVGAESPSTGLEGQPPPVGLEGVFSAIETRIADSLLESEVFDSVCAGGIARGPYRKNSNGRNRRNDNRIMRAVGISSNPEDQILEGLSCQTFVNETDGPCLVVDGEFVVYLDIYEDLDGTLTEIIADMMNVRHELDNVHPYIQKVRYISLSAESVSGSIGDEEIQEGQPGGSNGTLSSSFYALMAAGTFLVVGTAIFYRRRRNAAEHDGETTTVDQSGARLQESQEAP